jgi:hypothetical protein
VDVRLVEVAALLHDIDKPMTREGGERHGEAGARMLREMGFGELAPPVASHTIEAVLDEARYPRGWPSVLLWVADKHVAQTFMTIDQRLADMAARHPVYHDEIEAAARPAHALERELAEVTGLSITELLDRLRSAWELGTVAAGSAAQERGGRQPDGS